MIQAKRETSFTETAFDKASSSLGRLLDLNETNEGLRVYYSAELLTRIGIFTKAWVSLGARSPKITIKFDYVTKGDLSAVAGAVEQKRADLEAFLPRLVPGAKSMVRLVGARELWAIASSAPAYDHQLRFEDYVSKGDSYSGLVSLSDYFRFLSDDHGALQGHLFDWNVRDFQGEVSVNRDIQKTLDSHGEEDFWWLNNGVTVLCSSVNIGGDKTFTLEGVQIVNGMQTSHSIHSAITRIGVDAKRSLERSVLVRVFKSQNEEVRDQIIRATNSQTKVPDASLHATENIHRQIEAHFKASGWYYDRRKNFYKNTGKPADRIVSISALGQAVMAMALGRPNDARARPSSLLNNEADYGAIFSEKVALGTYLWLAKVQRNIDGLLLSTDVNADPYTRTNFRFYVSSYLVTEAHKSRLYSPAQLTVLSTSTLGQDASDVKAALDIVTTVAEQIADQEDWALDRVAKSKQLADAVIDRAVLDSESATG